MEREAKKKRSQNQNMSGLTYNQALSSVKIHLLGKERYLPFVLGCNSGGSLVNDSIEFSQWTDSQFGNCLSIGRLIEETKTFFNKNAKIKSTDIWRSCHPKFWLNKEVSCRALIINKALSYFFFQDDENKIIRFAKLGFGDNEIKWTHRSLFSLTSSQLESLGKAIQTGKNFGNWKIYYPESLSLIKRDLIKWGLA